MVVLLVGLFEPNLSFKIRILGLLWFGVCILSTLLYWVQSLGLLGRVLLMLDLFSRQTIWFIEGDLALVVGWLQGHLGHALLLGWVVGWLLLIPLFGILVVFYWDVFALTSNMYIGRLIVRLAWWLLLLCITRMEGFR